MAYLTILGLGLTVLSWRALTSPLRGVRQLSVRASSKTTLLPEPQTFQITSSRLHNILEMPYVLEWMSSDKK
jgi:hypothetical protein